MTSRCAKSETVRSALHRQASYLSRHIGEETREGCIGTNTRHDRCGIELSLDVARDAGEPNPGEMKVAKEHSGSHIVTPANPHGLLVVQGDGCELTPASVVKEQLTQ
jgi:hypothetical protein